MSERDICKKCGQMFTYHGGGQCPGYNEHIDMTNKTEKPAREFWIEPIGKNDDIVHRTEASCAYKAPEQLVHVIEYSAYAAEKEARQKAEIERDEYKYGYKEFCDQLNKASDTTMAALETAMRFSKERDQLKEKLERSEAELEKEKREHRHTMMGADVEAKAGDEARAKLAVAIEQFNNLNKVWAKLGPDKDDDFGHMNEAMKKMNKALKKLEEK